MKIDVCLEMVFTDLPYHKRIELISKAGFKSVEFWFHDWTAGDSKDLNGPKDAATLRQICDSRGVTINNMVVNAPDGSIGGSLANPADRQKYLERLHEVIEFARSAGIDKAITCTGNAESFLTPARMKDSVIETLSLAAAVAAKNDFYLVLEPLNTLVDHAGYFLDSSAQALSIVRSVNSPHLRLLYDVYHMQIMEGNVISTIRNNIGLIGHFHAAGVPGRHELMSGELNYAEILKSIDAAGYDGSFGLEYTPASDSAASMAATRAYLADWP